MSWVAIVFWIVRNIPTLISLVKELIKIIHGHPQEGMVKNMIANAILMDGTKEGVSHALTHCIGIACPPNVVKE